MPTVESVIFPYDDAERTKFARYQPENTYVWTSPGAPPLPELTEVAADQRGQHISIPGVTLSALAGVLAIAGVVLLGRRGWQPTSLVVLLLAAASGFAGWRGLQKAWPETVYWGPRVAPATATAIFQQLHKNMFRAFDYYLEEDIYDALAASVDGPLLRKTFLDINERLKMQDQGGAVSRIEEVKFLDGGVDPDSDPPTADAFAVRCRWNLVGSIEHWGHIHQRSIVYDGIFDVELRDDHWKIVEMRIVDEEPPKIKTTPRRLKATPEETSANSSEASTPAL
jgi:hypothetical protein